MLFSPSLAFLTSSVGTGEWVVLFVVVLIVVGPKRLPEVARKIGRTLEMFRRAADEFRDQLLSMDQEPPKAPAPGSPSGETGAAEQADPYSDAYPNMADYPGNEEHVENWPPEAPPEQEQAASLESEKPAAAPASPEPAEAHDEVPEEQA
jgi:TatA/E family protein of Tat protein translocase